MRVLRCVEVGCTTTIIRPSAAVQFPYVVAWCNDGDVVELRVDVMHQASSSPAGAEDDQGGAAGAQWDGGDCQAWRCCVET